VEGPAWRQCVGPKKAAHRKHPGWYRDTLANPDVEQVGTAKLKAPARIATGEERARLWEKALEF
jgi:proline iminopeptidase